MSAKKAAAMFEKAAEDSTKPVANAKFKKETTWTPHNDGAHTQVGFQRQTEKAATAGPPAKRSLNDLP
jgi:hypothetical protein